MSYPLSAAEQKALDVHSLTFSDLDGNNKKNTYLDWGLIPDSRPRIKKGALQSRYVVIPGSSVELDLTEALTPGEPQFSSREDTITFYVDYDRLFEKYPEWKAPTISAENLFARTGIGASGVISRVQLKSYAWDHLYDEIAAYLHGQDLRMVLVDDPFYYYEGRWQVDDWLSEASYSQIVLSYHLNAYKIEFNVNNTKHV